jgi:hypothetical protein
MKILAYVKDVGFKLNTMVTIGLKLVVICEVLDLEENCQGTCFEDAFLKAFQYATTDEKSTKA